MDIKRIEKLCPNWYDKNNELPYDDQLWIWENVPLPQKDIDKINEIEAIENGISVNGNVNSTYKQQPKTSQNISKKEAITKLKLCNYRTAPKVIASYLEIVFNDKKTKPGHWLYIAQHYTPKTINSVLSQMIKSIARGDVSPQVPSAYFTYVVKKRHMRKKFQKNKKFVRPNF